MEINAILLHCNDPEPKDTPYSRDKLEVCLRPELLTEDVFTHERRRF